MSRGTSRPSLRASSRDSSIRSPARVCDTRYDILPGTWRGRTGHVNRRDRLRAPGVPSDGTAEAVVVNLTGVAGNASTYLSLFPTDSTATACPPGRRRSTFCPAWCAANRVMVELGPTTIGRPRRCAVRVQRRRHHQCARRRQRVVRRSDGDGNAPPGTNTRRSNRPGSVTRASCRRRAHREPSAPAPSSVLITVAGHAGVPSFASLPVVAIIANLTAVAPTARTYLTLYPASQSSPPTVSDLNVEVGAVLANGLSSKSTQLPPTRTTARSTCTTVQAASTRSSI